MVYTNEERIDRIWDRENCVQLMNRHAIYYSNDMRRAELDDLWVQDRENQKTASLAYNNGYYVGMDAISQHYVVEREQQLYDRLKPYCQADPSVESCRENLGLGASAMHTSTTPLIYIADDGKTARFQGYQLGYQSVGSPDGTAESYLEFGLVYADLIREEGGWKIWHLVLEHDHTVEVGHAYAEVPVLRPDSEDPIIQMDCGTPTVQRTVFDPFYGWEYIWQDMPRPYETYRDVDGYGPNGNLGKPYYERERR
ncbi:MAG: nuclear transport factor 2 family protein [Oscillospiraceae bacterium]|nr:nuclear transport factor 2 family protein [Oscillospiraceae bacterium]